MAKGPRRHVTPEDDAESQRILQITRDLCQQLRIRDYNPSRVSWLKHRPGGGAKLAPDRPLLLADRIVLPDGIQGRLGPDRWRSILAAALIRRKSQTLVRFGSLTIFISLIGVLAAGWIFLPTILPWQVSVGGYRGIPEGHAALGSAVMLYFSPILLIVSSLLLIGWWRRWWMVTSDYQAADLLGKDTLLGALKNIRDIEGSLAHRTRPRRGILMTLGLEERITRIEKWTPSQQDRPKLA